MQKWKGGKARKTGKNVWKEKEKEKIVWKLIETEDYVGSEKGGK